MAGITSDYHLHERQEPQRQKAAQPPLACQIIAQSLYTGLHTKDRAVLRRAMQYFAVIALFAVGAAAGSLLTIHFGNRVIWFCCASLLVSLSFMFIREDIEENPELQREAAALHQDVKAMEHTIGKTLQEQQEELHPLNHK